MTDKQAETLFHVVRIAFILLCIAYAVKLVSIVC